MADGLYVTYKNLILQAGLNLSTLNLRFALVDLADYSENLTTDDFMADVDVAGAVEGETGNLASKAFSGANFDAADPVFSSISGDQCEALVLFRQTGTRATENVIAFFDSITAITPNGGDINVTLNASGIFTL